MKSKEELIIAQFDLMQIIIRKAKINIVTCCHCGSILLHKIKPMTDYDVITCYGCKREVETSDCPDYFYEGMELSEVHQEEDKKTKPK